jgi:RNA polymerase sigma-70 factor (ECF subfamily)
LRRHISSKLKHEKRNNLSGEPSKHLEHGKPVFATTHWTQVLQARGDSPESKAALSDLCAAYYEPVFSFIRRNTREEDSARDLTQEFFSRLLSRHGIDSVDPERGRFRSFLLGAVKHFLGDMRDRANRLKRGSGQALESLDCGTETSPVMQLADQNMLGPDREFDRKWALTILDRALEALAEEHKAAGKLNQFETLKPWLTGDTENLSQADAARDIQLNEGAVKVAIHRLRRRFRELVKKEIGQTLKDPSQIQDELDCLFAALSER